MTFEACPLARREAPTAGRRPAGEGANSLVPYTRDAMRTKTKSRIEFIYLFIYMHQPRSSCAASEHLGLAATETDWLTSAFELIFKLKAVA